MTSLATLLPFLLLSFYNTEAFLSANKDFLSRRKQGPYTLNLHNITNCNLKTPPNASVVYKNLTLIRRNNKVLIYYEAAVVGETKDVRINLKISYLDDKRNVTVLTMKNMGCHTPFTSSLLRFFHLPLKANSCSCKKQTVKGLLDLDTILHKFVQQVWFGVGTIVLEFISKKNGDSLFCAELWGSCDPIPEKPTV